MASSEPSQSRLISLAERNYLAANSKVAQCQQKQTKTSANRCNCDDNSTSISWTKLVCDPNIWALIAVKFSLRWHFGVLNSLLPTYLSSVAHLSVDTIGRMSVIQSSIGLVSGLAISFATKSLVSRRPCNLSLASVRKLFQSVVNFGIALSLISFVVFDCNQYVSLASLTVGAVCANLHVAGALQLPLDLSPANCGLISSLTDTLAPGLVLGPPISGLMLSRGAQDRAQWRLVWLTMVAMNTISGVLFLVLVDSKPRDYSRRGEHLLHNTSCQNRQTDGRTDEQVDRQLIN